MEADEMKSDLYALRQLYGLLQSLVVPENVFKSLDERALQLLKRLLDNAMHELSIIELKADHYDQPKMTTKSKQIVPSKPRHNNDQQMVNADFASSSTGFSTPTSLGFEDDIVDDTNSDDGDDDQHRNFSKAIGELDSHILAIHLQESTSHPNHNVKTKPKESKMESRIPSPPVDSNDKVYRKTMVDHHVGIRNRKPRPNNFTLAPRRGRIVPQPSYSTDQSRSTYSSDYEDEDNSGISPSEGSESIDDHYYDDGDEAQTSGCSGSSNSSYGTAKSGVEDYSERATRVSTLRRIRNKLGLIFHHHHHHHHHQYHHDDCDHDRSPNHIRRSSSSKPLHGMFRDDNKGDEGLFDTRTNTKDATRRGSRATRSSVDRVRRDGGARDAGHFRALVEAMSEHVGGGGGRRNPGRRGGGGGVKINGNHRRGRVKFGFKKTSQPHKLKM